MKLIITIYQSIAALLDWLFVAALGLVGVSFYLSWRRTPFAIERRAGEFLIWFKFGELFLSRSVKP